MVNEGGYPIEYISKGLKDNDRNYATAWYFLESWAREKENQEEEQSQLEDD
jgi:hypothetical protein